MQADSKYIQVILFAIRQVFFLLITYFEWPLDVYVILYLMRIYPENLYKNTDYFLSIYPFNH